MRNSERILAVQLGRSGRGFEVSDRSGLIMRNTKTVAGPEQYRDFGGVACRSLERQSSSGQPAPLYRFIQYQWYRS